MKKTYWILGIIFIFFLSAVMGLIFNSTKKPTATIANQTIKLYVAKTQKEKEMGLSKFKSLPQDFGMIFLFDKPDFYSFWMKDMKFPIDILFIKDNKIITIYQNVSETQDKNDALLIYQPTSKANKVLEIQAGFSKKYNIKDGNIVTLKNL